MTYVLTSSTYVLTTFTHKRFLLLMNLQFLHIPLNLNDLSWNLISLVSFDKSFFFHLDENSCTYSFHWFFLVEVFSSLMTIIFSHSLMLSQKPYLSLMDFFFPNLMEWTIHFLWWALFSELSELFIFSLELVTLSSLRTLSSGAKSIRSTFPQLKI